MRGDKNQPNDSQKSDGLWDGSMRITISMEADWGKGDHQQHRIHRTWLQKADITLTEVNPGTDGNMGLIIRGSNYLENVDGAGRLLCRIWRRLFRWAGCTMAGPELAKVDAQLQ